MYYFVSAPVKAIELLQEFFAGINDTNLFTLKSGL